MVDDTKKRDSRKPRKPYDDYPLTPHSNGQFCKKIKGKIFYFGSDPAKALELYRLQGDDLHAGRTPRRSPDDLMVEDICNLFLDSKQKLVGSGRMTLRTWRGYKHVCKRVSRVLGHLVAEHLTPIDFDRLYEDVAHSCRTLKAIDSTCNVCRLPFTWAYKEARLLERAPYFGSLLKRLSRKELRKDKAKRRHENGKMMFDAPEVRAILIASPPHIRAMVWLAINCGFGNADVGSLMTQDLDLYGRWVRLPRSKSGEDRRCPLWPQTVYAVRVALAARPVPADRSHDNLVFVTAQRNPWHDDRKGIQSPLSQVFRRILEGVKMYRRGRNFYALRHTFQTIAENATKDGHAIETIMGHVDATMAAEYREYVADDRLHACTDAVREWLMVERTEPKS
jgi:integrase